MKASKIRENALILGIFVSLVTSGGLSAAQDKHDKSTADTRPIMAFVPPLIVQARAPGGADALREHILSNVIPRVANDVKRDKWPLRVALPEAVAAAFQTASLSGPPDLTDVQYLGSLADAAPVRYINVIKK
jgi:hypothetical protein